MSAAAKTFGALLALTAATFGLSFAGLPSWAGAAAALAIAVAKAALVAAVFMGLSRERASSRLVLVVAALLVAILAGLGAADVATR